jgi:hypothetical protein
MINLLFSYKNISSLSLTGKPNQLISSHHESALSIIDKGRFFLLVKWNRRFLRRQNERAHLSFPLEFNNCQSLKDPSAC